MKLFQSTPLREGRLFERGRGELVVPVSIHAPARGATAFPEIQFYCYTFQSTPLREGRLIRLSANRL